MLFQQSSRAARLQWQLHGRRLGQRVATTPFLHAHPARAFHGSRSLLAVKPVLLADIGEGIVECEIVQWFVEPGARVEEFSPLCEVQSDKASVEITSRFAGVVKKLHYGAGEFAKVGKPFVDIDIVDDGKTPTGDLEAVAPTTPDPVPAPAPSPSAQPPPLMPAAVAARAQPDAVREPPVVQTGKHAALATPATRHLSKELGVEISHVPGTGKDGRVTKEDILKFAADKQQTPPPPPPPAPSTPATGPQGQLETPQPLTRTQEIMFKTMTRSLTIPHFLYADEVDMTSLVALRRRLNTLLPSPLSPASVTKLSYLPFIIKAVSLALHQHPILNARVDTATNPSRPALVHRTQHNIGVAMDTPHGLLVPVVRDVANLNVLSIAAELARLQALAAAGRLAPADMSGGTITVSNIGSIGGTYLSPVIVEREVAILGIGRMRTQPAFSTVPGEEDRVVRREVCNFSWSADHRVVDGATMARAAEVVRGIVEEPDVMVMHLR
ncbi:2-oxoacid dehydrogenases acyltransferase-domain-containing protein [Podospora conica]|nr:2-oxoacid dehydrogenases acyltransferase-domain-containing protein [Schizothecium conicum]